MGKTLQKKKGFSMPHVYIVILILMLIITVLTYVIPAGSYVRDASGTVDPNSFSFVEQTPVGFLQFFTALHQGFVESASIIGAVLLISGCIQIINRTGAFSAGIQSLIRISGKGGVIMVILFFTLFTALGVIGYLDALYPFYPIIISLFISLGYDKMVGTAVILLSTAVGLHGQPLYHRRGPDPGGTAHVLRHRLPGSGPGDLLRHRPVLPGPLLHQDQKGPQKQRYG